MAKILIPAAHLSLPEVETQVKKTKEVVEKMHWQIIRLMLKGKRSPEVAEIFNLSVGWVREIVRRYNRQGPSALKDKRAQNGGNRSVLNEGQKQELMDTLEHQKPPDGGLWTCWKVRDWIKEKTGQTISINSAWKYFKRLGFSVRVLRPRHVKADPLKQEEFKKKYSAS